MKTHAKPVPRVAACAALLLSLLPALHAETTMDAPGERLSQSLDRPAADPRGRSASDVLGQTVYGSGGASLGKITDLLVDPRRGRVAYAVVGSGGVLGINRDLRVVPASALRTDSGRFSVDIETDRWTQAPVFAKEQLRGLAGDRRAADVAEYFGQGGLSAKNSDADRYILLSDIRGKDIIGAEGEIGEVDDVIVQLDKSKVAALVDPDDKFAASDRKFLVPLNKLSGFEGANLRAQLGREDFEQARSYEAADAERGDIGATLLAWGQSAKHAIQRGADRVAEGAEHMGDRAENAGDRAADRMNDRAADTTASGRTASVEAVRRAVQAETRAAGVDSKVSVVAENDKVVLRGTVPSEDVKERIEERAEHAAPGWNIDNQLRVAANR